MAPFIRDGDLITISPLQTAHPEIGEVIAYIRPQENKLVVHRLVDWSNRNAIFLGDNELEYPKEPIPQECLIGTVTRIERNGHPIWLGLGPERLIIAWLSRSRLLTPLLTRVTNLLKPIIQLMR